MKNADALRRSKVFALVLLGFLVLFENPAAGADVTLAWNANVESDLAGYGIYARRDADGPPYDLAGYVALEELPDPGRPTFTVSGLEKGFTYFFAATAYDTAGNESSFSNPACARVGDQIEVCSDGGSGAKGSGGGGGGGCFIRTTAPW